MACLKKSVIGMKKLDTITDLPNLQAAVGVAQLERADHLVSQKRWMAEIYEGQIERFSPFLASR